MLNDINFIHHNFRMALKRSRDVLGKKRFLHTMTGR